MVGDSEPRSEHRARGVLQPALLHQQGDRRNDKHRQQWSRHHAVDHRRRDAAHHFAAGLATPEQRQQASDGDSECNIALGRKRSSVLVGQLKLVGALAVMAALMQELHFTGIGFRQCHQSPGAV